ncbi:hypothetical protein B0H12DRAFT_1079848 [Mycena haematopus]|nr:hypothetical protein B0H12DRAFT_1079848 [Mycena haematopus]
MWKNVVRRPDFVCSEKRAEIAASDFHTRRKYQDRAAANSERYRDNKLAQDRADERVVQTVKKQARDAEQKAIQQKHQPNPEQRPIPATPTQTAAPHLSNITCTPRPAKTTRINAGPAALRRAPNDFSEDEEESDAEDSAPASVWPERAPPVQRCPHCFQGDCVGLLLELSTIMSFLCTPAFVPDPGHGDEFNHPGPFYAIFCREFRGCVTSRVSRDKLLTLYPHASTWEAPTWADFIRVWTHECTEYHDHNGDPGYVPPGVFVPLSPSPESTPPSSPSSLSTSTVSLASESAHPHAAPPQPSMLPSTPTKRTSSAPLTKEDLTFLANFRPGPEPLSPQRANQLFARVLGQDAVRHLSAPRRQPAVQLPMAHEVADAMRAGARLAKGKDGGIRFVWPEAGPVEEDVEARHRFVEDITSDARCAPPAPLMFAVSGSNRIFQDRSRAMAALKRNPSADLIFTRDEDEAFAFLAGADAA